MDKSSPDWSSLPCHLLAKIAQNLRTRFDILRFRAVCNSFRSSVPPPNPFSRFSDIHYYYKSSTSSISSIRFTIAESTVYAFEPISEISNKTQPTPRTWLLKVEESNSGKVQVLNPFSTFHFKHISETLPKSLNLLDYQVKEMSKEYRVQLAEDQPPLEDNFFKKLVVSNHIDDEFAFMVYVEGQVAVWRRRDNKWAYIDIVRRGLHFNLDIIYHNKKFYVLSSNGLSITVDAKSLTISEPVAPLPISEESTVRIFLLVKSSTDLFSIKINQLSNNPSYINRLSRCYWVGLDMFKLDAEKNEWIEMKDGFKDRAFLVCRECKLFLSAKEFSECKQNCVYKDERVPLGDSCDSEYNYPGKYAVIFNLEDGVIGWLISFPGDSEIFWPLPAWPFPESKMKEQSVELIVQQTESNTWSNIWRLSTVNPS